MFSKKVIIISGVAALLIGYAAADSTVNLARTNYRLQHAAEAEGRFSDNVYKYLTDRFEAQGLLNTGSNFFDFSEPLIRESYKGTAANYGKPRSGLQESKSRDNIERAVEEHLKDFGREKTLIVISGEAREIWGAVQGLESRFGVKYIPVTPKRPGLEEVTRSPDFISMYGNGVPSHLRMAFAREMVRNQFDLIIGMARALEYESPEAFMQERLNFTDAKIPMVGIEETALRSLYSDNDKKQAYDILLEISRLYQAKSILLITDLPMDSAASDFIKSTEDSGIKHRISPLTGNQVRIPGMGYH